MTAFILTLMMGVIMVFATSLLHYEVLRVTWDIIPRLKLYARLRIIPVIIAIFVSHTVGVWLYAALYKLLEEQGGFGAMVINGAPKHDFVTALYFSAITYSTVGYGDVLPTGWLRILAGIEALNGLVLIGWSISFTYLALQHLWETHKKR
jgi:hypothetical protein